MKTLETRTKEAGHSMIEGLVVMTAGITSIAVGGITGVAAAMGRYEYFEAKEYSRLIAPLAVGPGFATILAGWQCGIAAGVIETASFGVGYGIGATIEYFKG